MVGDCKSAEDGKISLPTRLAATASGILSSIGTEISNVVNRVVAVQPSIKLPHQSYAVGDCVFRSKPYLWVVGNKHISNYCNMCAVTLPETNESMGGAGDNVPAAVNGSRNNNSETGAVPNADIFDFDVCKCPSCDLATYCSPRCRHEAWTVGMHEKECILYLRWIAAARREEENEKRNAENNDSGTTNDCKQLSNGTDKGTTNNGESTQKAEEATEKPLHGCVPKKLTRMIALAILKLAEGLERNMPGQSIPECNVSFWDLMAHWVGERDQRPTSIESVEWIRDQLTAVIPEEWSRERSFLEFDKLGNVYGRIVTNIFYIREYRHRLRQFGTALYLNPSKIDHSCTPSASYVHSCGNVLEVYAVEPVKSFKDVRVSYVSDLMRPRQWRSSQMTSLWLFECQCDGCLNDERERLLGGLTCTQNGCYGAVCADLNVCKRKVELELSAKEAITAPYPPQTEDAAEVVDPTAVNAFDKRDHSAKTTAPSEEAAVAADTVVKADAIEADNGDDVNDTSKDVENPETEVLPPLLPSTEAKDYGCTACRFHDFSQQYIDEAVAVLDATVKYVDNGDRTLELGLPLLERALKCLHPSNAMMMKFLLLLLDTNWNELSDSDIDQEMILVARVLPLLLLTIVRTMPYLPRELSFQLTVITRTLRYTKYIVEFKSAKQLKEKSSDDKAAVDGGLNGVQLLLKNFDDADEKKLGAWFVSKNEFIRLNNKLMEALRAAFNLHFSAAMRDHSQTVSHGLNVSKNKENTDEKNKVNLSPSVPWCSAVRKQGIYAEESFKSELDDELEPVVASLSELLS